MTFINVYERQRILRNSTGITPEDYSFTDMLAISAEDALRTMPTQSIARGLRGVFDSSEKIAPFEANERFGLVGEAAFQEGDEVTVSMAAEKAKDQAKLARIDHLNSLYSSENPISGIVANFMGAFGAAFVDPVSLAINVGTTVAVAKGLGAFFRGTAAGTSAVNALGKYSPKAGEALIQIYNNKAAQNLTSIALREGTENFLAATLEESVNVLGIGEERLARKVGIQESLRNIVVGTTFGTGAGIVLTKGGRKAIMDRANRMFGDKAPEVVEAQNKVLAVETAMDLPPSTFLDEQVAKEQFDSKSWHVEEADNIDHSAAPKEGKYYVPIDDEKIHNVSTRGDSLVVTSNVNHAQNLGNKVKEVDINETNILDDSKLQGTDGRKNRFKNKLINNLLDDLLEGADQAQLNAMFEKYLGVNFEGNTKLKPLRKTLKEDFMQKDNMEDILKWLEEYSAAGNLDYNGHKIISDILDENGFDGYSFKGKDGTGADRYTGIAFTQNGQNKLKTAREFDVPEPTFQQKTEYNLERQKEAEDFLEETSNKLKHGIEDEDADMIPEELDEVTDPMEQSYNNEIAQMYNTSELHKQAIDFDLDYLRKLKAEKEAAGKSLDTAQEKRLIALENSLKNKTFLQQSEEISEIVEAAKKCLKGIDE